MNVSPDWKHPVMLSEPDNGPCRSFTICGDWGPYGDYFQPMRKNPEGVYGDFLSVFGESDLRMLNLECALGGGAAVEKSGPVIACEDGHFPCLLASRVQIVSLANNHVFDHGPEGLRYTIEKLDQAHILHAGAGMTADEAYAPLRYELDGIKIGIVCFTESGSDMPDAAESDTGLFGWHPDRAAALIRELKQEGRIVFAVVHAGVEDIPFPPEYVQKTYRSLAAAGADAVVGHHPHVPQGVEMCGGTPVFYSLGNWLFPTTDVPMNSFGYAVRFRLQKSGILSFEILPYQIGKENISLLKDSAKEQFLEYLQKISGRLSADGTTLWNAILFSRYCGDCHRKTWEADIRRFETDPRRAACVLRNRFSKVCHVHFWHDYFDRMADGTFRDIPEWAVSLLEECKNIEIKKK